MFVPRPLPVPASYCRAAITIAASNAAIATSIRNANTAGVRDTPVPFFIKIQRNFRAAVAGVRVWKLRPAPFVPRNLAKSFTLSTHRRDKACIRSYYLTVYNLASSHTKAGAKQATKLRRPAPLQFGDLRAKADALLFFFFFPFFTEHCHFFLYVVFYFLSLHDIFPLLYTNDVVEAIFFISFGAVRLPLHFRIQTQLKRHYVSSLYLLTLQRQQSLPCLIYISLSLFLSR